MRAFREQAASAALVDPGAARTCGCSVVAKTVLSQNVLMNSMSARLSSSLSRSSLPNAFSSSLRVSALLNSSVPK